MEEGKCTRLKMYVLPATPAPQHPESKEPGRVQKLTRHVPQVLAILENPSSSRLLIDVREPHEYEANTIPTAINIPIASQPDALLLSAEDFQDAFGFVKPPPSKEIVMFCKAGVRSAAAAGIARQAGYENVGEYKGSWNEWVAKGGPGTKTPNEPGTGKGEAKGPQTETKVTERTGSAGEEHIGKEGIPQPPPGGMMGKQ
jgi:rhodanese-related sulfurtransferase